MTAPKPTLEAAIDLFNRQEFFECHEVLEDLWRPLPAGPEKMLLQGLLQVGVGYYHWQRGNAVGARNKLRSGLEKLEAVASQPVYSPPVRLEELLQPVQHHLNQLLEQKDESIPALNANRIPLLIKTARLEP